jgi:hypothetical protein
MHLYRYKYNIPSTMDKIKNELIALENAVFDTAAEVRSLKAACASIEARNISRDVDKRFEASFTRVFIIMVLTYLTMTAYLIALGKFNAFFIMET